MKKGQIVEVYLDQIEGKVEGILLEEYSLNRWLIKCANTNVVRVVRNTEYKNDGCGYIKEIQTVENSKKDYKVECFVSDKFKGRDGLKKLAKLLSKNSKNEEVMYKELCKSNNIIEDNHGSL